MRGLPVTLLAVALLAFPLTSAAPASAGLRLAAPTHLAGQFSLASDRGLLEIPQVQWLSARGALLSIVLVPMAPQARPQAGSSSAPTGLSAIGDALHPPAASVAEPRSWEMASPERIVFTTWQSSSRSLLAVGPYDEGSIFLEGSSADIASASSAALGALPETFAPADAAWVGASFAGSARLSGTVRGLFTGVTMLAQNATDTIALDATLAHGTPWLAILRWTGAAVSLPAAQEKSLRLLAPTMDLDLRGALSAAKAWGPVQAGARNVLADGDAVAARGRLAGQLSPGPGGTVALQARGDLTSLEVGGKALDIAPAAAAGAGLAALGALAWYGQHVRFLAAPLYARIAPSALLDNDIRRRVHAQVGEHPGSDVKDTAQAVGVSWSTAAYHLARLEREGVVTSRRAGRSKRFFINGGANSGKAEVIGALRNPTSLAIAKLVAAQPGLMQKEIGAALQLPASTVSWHMRRLRGLGVVHEDRRWRQASYVPGAVWGEVGPLLSVSSPAAPAA